MAIRTVILKGGQSTVLPSSAEILSVVINGSVTATSTCDNLPEPTAYKCWRFVWQDVSADPNYNDAYFTGIKIGDATYSVEGAPVSEANSYDNGPDFLEQAIPVSTPEGLVTDIVSSDPLLGDQKCIKISIPSGLGQPILYWTNPVTGGYTQSSAFLGEEDECTCPEDL